MYSRANCKRSLSVAQRQCGRRRRTGHSPWGKPWIVRAALGVSDSNRKSAALPLQEFAVMNVRFRLSPPARALLVGRAEQRSPFRPPLFG